MRCTLRVLINKLQKTCYILRDFEDLTTVTVKNAVVWDVAPSNLVELIRVFGGRVASIFGVEDGDQVLSDCMLSRTRRKHYYC
jgi:hypothetical protein